MLRKACEDEKLIILSFYNVSVHLKLLILVNWTRVQYVQNLDILHQMVRTTRYCSMVIRKRKKINNLEYRL